MAAALFPYVLLFLALLELARNFQLGNSLFALALPYSALAMPLALYFSRQPSRVCPKISMMQPGLKVSLCVKDCDG